ncbi:LacI family DNA-binding transcriptional regulator [Anaerobacillus sp. MEB173]|uniref:LacI family DNA-binding transcriptional regulator n=1 Tax=Anaerobacillus sp. MEB173 TaxID=3383345 RepID=UPI003F8F0103
MRKVTITDVAKKANVSKSTVSQYLNKRFDYMAEKTKERIEQAIEELGYKPNIVARSLKQKSTSTIGVIVANILHAFSTQVIRAIEDYCHEYGFHIIVCNADDEPEKEKKYIEMLLAKQVDGLIIFPTVGNVDTYQDLVKANYPVVFIDRMVHDVKIPSVMLNNEKASDLAVTHFAEKGYKKIGIITTSVSHNVTPRIERVKGFKKSLVENNLPVINDFIKSLEVDEIQQGLKDMLQQENCPDALLAGNDLVLMEILKYVKDHSINIPTELAVIGIDDVEFAGVYYPTLTTIAQPTFEMGLKAATLILDKLQNKEIDSEEIYRFEPTLISRESC